MKRDRRPFGGRGEKKKKPNAHVLEGEPAPLSRSELLRMATRRAARYGLDGDLIDVIGERSLPAAEMLQTLLGFVRPALEEHDEWEVISGLVDQLVQGGTGAARQRRAFEHIGSDSKTSSTLSSTQQQQNLDCDCDRARRAGPPRRGEA